MRHRARTRASAPKIDSCNFVLPLFSFARFSPLDGLLASSPHINSPLIWMSKGISLLRTSLFASQCVIKTRHQEASRELSFQIYCFIKIGFIKFIEFIDHSRFVRCMCHKKLCSRFAFTQTKLPLNIRDLAP